MATPAIIRALGNRRFIVEKTELMADYGLSGCGSNYLRIALVTLTFNDPGPLNGSVPPTIFAMGMIPGAGIDSSSLR